jgi:hypothetical protein
MLIRIFSRPRLRATIRGKSKLTAREYARDAESAETDAEKFNSLYLNLRSPHTLAKRAVQFIFIRLGR